MSNSRKRKDRKSSKRIHTSNVSARETSSDLEHFSPVFVPGSPADSSQHHSGTGRTQVQQVAANWDKYVEQWNRLNVTGSALVVQMKNLKFSTMNQFEVESDETSEDQQHTAYPEGLQELCDKLQETVEAMAEISGKMDNLTEQLKALVSLGSFHSSEVRSQVGSTASASVEEELSASCGQESGCASFPLFLTWPLGRFYEVSQYLSQMFEKELKVKQCVLESIAHCQDRDVIKFFTSTWIHQPFIEDQGRLMLEGMLIETGHR